MSDKPYYSDNFLDIAKNGPFKVDTLRSECIVPYLKFSVVKLMFACLHVFYQRHSRKGARGGEVETLKTALPAGSAEPWPLASKLSMP